MAKHFKHQSARVGWRRAPGVAGAVVLVTAVAVGLASSNSGSGLEHPVVGPVANLAAPAANGQSSAAVQALMAAVSLNPGGGTDQVSPDTPVAVHTTVGKLASVTLTTGANPPLPGALSADGRSWQVSQGLAASTPYQLAVALTGASGAKATVTKTFATLAVPTTMSATVKPDDGSTVGVGSPIVVKFNRAVPASNQTSVLSHLGIAESQPVPGGWHWFSDRELHLRPQSFWPTGEQITVTTNLDGWDAGANNWGSGQSTTHIRIGDSHVAVADLSAEKMTVSDNGQVIATYPISGGSSRYPTQDGIHLAMDKEPVVHMVSSTVGIPAHGPGGYDEYVYNDVHISDTGEYVHDAPWSEGSQGRSNVSHGCVNLGRNDSKAFYDFSQIGDVIEVVGGTRPPEPLDHGVMDWTLDWSQWTPALVTGA
ncbi:MAG: Ig-like domain-containing protein [Actinomycetota bacterium]|nr:Ig-like domain-containing protein [Actinomycetota bacterium]